MKIILGNIGLLVAIMNAQIYGIVIINTTDDKINITFQEESTDGMFKLYKPLSHTIQSKHAILSSITNGQYLVHVAQRGCTSTTCEHSFNGEHVVLKKNMFGQLKPIFVTCALTQPLTKESIECIIHKADELPY